MRRAPAILVVAAALLLAGCGYRPLYGSSSETAGVAATLSSVSIPEAEDRVGQLIRNDLLSSMRAGEGEQKYTLLQAETNATERAVHEVSSDIRTRLAAYFAKQQP